MILFSKALYEENRILCSVIMTKKNQIAKCYFFSCILFIWALTKTNNADRQLSMSVQITLEWHNVKPEKYSYFPLPERLSEHCGSTSNLAVGRCPVRTD